jgi:hypothetical protein
LIAVLIPTPNCFAAHPPVKTAAIARSRRSRFAIHAGLFSSQHGEPETG